MNHKDTKDTKKGTKEWIDPSAAFFVSFVPSWFTPTLTRSWPLLIALLVIGCGGATPGFVPMNDDLRERAQGSGILRQRSRAARFWPIERWRAVALKATVLNRGSERVADAGVEWREVTFGSEPLPGNAQQIHATLVTPAVGRDGGTTKRRNGETGKARPALVWVHDMGETAPTATAKEWAARGYAVLAIELPGRGPGRESSRSTGPDFTEEAIFKVAPAATESYLYSAVGAVTRGMQWLRSQEGIDRGRIALVGAGWGAVIARLAAVADEQARALVLLYAAGNLDRGAVGERLRTLPARERTTWTAQYDPVSYAAGDAPPALFVTATGSKEFPFDAFVDGVRKYRGSRALALTPNAARDLDSGATVAMAAWLDAILRGSAALAAPRAVKEVTDGVTVELPARTPVRTVSLYAAEAGGDWASREWREVKATRVDDRRWRAPLPRDKDGRLPLYFVRVTDTRGAALAALPPGPSAPEVARARRR